LKFDVSPVSSALASALTERIDQKTKPPGALGVLEQLALQIGLIQETLTPEINKPVIAVFAADHGVTTENISAFPAEVTAQMVLNFLGGGAAINVFARQHGIDLKVVDAGVNATLPEHPALIAAKVASGTRNFLEQAAMSTAECEQALNTAAQLVTEWHETGSNVIGFGEMGIGNTTAAAALTALLADLPLQDTVGSGTGLDDAGVSRKQSVIEQSIKRACLEVDSARADPMKALRELGGFEIAMICGGMLRAAELGMVILVDGFIATSAYLCASALQPNIRDYCVFCHQSEERGHAGALRRIDVRPLLDLGMRLGEGTGAAVCLPILVSAVAFLNEMSSFSDADVSGKKE